MEDYKMYETMFHTVDLADKSFLITGGAGFIGSNLVEYLLKYGARKVRILDNFSTGSHANLADFLNNPSFELMEGDVRNLEDCRMAVANIQYVSHQAALGSVPRSLDDPITTNDVNIGGFLNMLVAARDEKVISFVYAASSSTYGDHPGLPKIENQIGSPLSPYAVTKYVNELYSSVFFRNYGFKTIGLRYFNIFGPRQNVNGPYAAVIPLFINAALDGRSPEINGDGETSRDFTFVENAIQANIKALLSNVHENSEVINIAVGERTSLNTLWSIIASHANLQIAPLYKNERKGDVKHSLANITKAEHLIGYRPNITVAKGITISYNWYMQNYKLTKDKRNP
jgi:UDP-N-acetylglucosamine 4-epimerase